MVRAKQGYIEDRPLQIEAAMADSVKFNITQDNIDALWSKINQLFNPNSATAQGLKIKTTDDLLEGLVNLYYTDARVAYYLATHPITFLNNSMIKVEYDEREFTYTSGLLTQVVYKLAAAVVETLTITYDTSGRPATATTAVGGQTLTLTHAGTGFLTEAVAA